ncbi:MAG TPA: DUF4199 domain-containing protein [Thermoanaerobaculia bacterium]
MKRIVLIHGLVAGAIVAGLMAISVTLTINGHIDLSDSQVVGYSSMVAAFLLVFFGIRSYRETAGGGAITFGKAFKIGILITLVASGVYVAVWQVMYWGFMPDFAEKYAACVIEDLREDGASAAEIAKTERQMADFQRLYRNPLFNVAVTFLEVFPVGLVVTLVSAAILRRKGAPPVADAATA